MILLIDNYDSFSYNLVQMAGSINPDIKVIRNDAMTVEEIRALAPSHIILSPGPGYPKDAGVCEEVVRHLLQVIGEDKNGEVMAVQHKTYPVYGLQFHPESILTPQGRIILENFLDL